MSDPTKVYVWRNPYGKVVDVSLEPIKLLGTPEKGVETLDILTPAHAAVIESALETREFYREGLGERGHPFPLSDLFEKVETLRKQLPTEPTP